MKSFLSLTSLLVLIPCGLSAQQPTGPDPIKRTREAVAAANENNAAVEEVLDSTAESLESATDGALIEEDAAASAAEAFPDDRVPTNRTGQPATSPGPPAPSESTEADPAAAVPAADSPATEPALPAESLVQFDMNYTDTPVRLILQNVADAAELNVIIPDDLIENTTIRLAGVTWPVLFDTVLENTGFTWAMGEDGIIRVQRIGADQAIEISETGLISVNFRNEPTRTAVQALAETVGLNIVIPADLDGSTSASLTNVAWERVLTEILKENDYRWFEDDGIIGIRKVDSRVVLDPQTGLLSINVENISFSELLTLIGQTQTPVVNVISAPEIKDLPVDLTVQGVTFEQSIDLAIGQLPRVTAGEGDGAAVLSYTTYNLGPNVIQVVDSAFLARLRSEPPVVRIFDRVVEQPNPLLPPGRRWSSTRCGRSAKHCCGPRQQPPPGDGPTHGPARRSLFDRAARPTSQTDSHRVQVRRSHRTGSAESGNRLGFPAGLGSHCRTIYEKLVPLAFADGHHHRHHEPLHQQLGCHHPKLRQLESFGPQSPRFADLEYHQYQRGRHHRGYYRHLQYSRPERSLLLFLGTGHR